MNKFNILFMSKMDNEEVVILLRGLEIQVSIFGVRCNITLLDETKDCGGEFPSSVGNLFSEPVQPIIAVLNSPIVPKCAINLTKYLSTRGSSLRKRI